MLYEVTVPEGCVTGDVFQVQIGADLVDVTTPAGCGAGDCFSIWLQTGADVGEHRLEDTKLATLEVEIPPGCFAGDEVIVEAPDGQTLAVVVPNDVAPGMILQISVPEPAESDGAESDDTVTGGGVYRAETAAFELDGPTDELAELFSPDGFDFEDSYLIQRSDGSYSSGWLKSYDCCTDMYHVLIPMVGYKYVTREQIELDTVHF